MEVSREPGPAQVVATGPVRPDGVAFERHFATDREHRIWVLFDPRRAPGGYAYLFTHAGRGTFGAAITLDFGRLREHASASWEFFRRIEAVPVRDEVQATTFMNFFIPERYEEGGALYAGEAAGLQDFLYGLAIRMALESGLLASRALLEGADYTALARERFSRRLGTGLVHRFLYERLGRAAFRRGLASLERRDYREALIRLSQGPAITPVLLPFIRFLWKNRGACPHPLRPHFCRRRAATTPTAGA
jgi:flavin-dependent dehydrogenase